MRITRRSVLRTAVALGATGGQSASASASTGSPTPAAGFGVLVDTTTCIGCRKCEWACNHANELPVQPLEAFEDTSVFARARRPDASHYTVVNRHPGSTPDAPPVHLKVQCMHCDDPACASACLVSALVKQPEGAVTYEPWRCMGCRYCMVVCPFGIPAYEYHNATTPMIRKCSLCHDRVVRQGKVPACVEICPPECLSFGRRDDLLAIAHRRIRDNPTRYVDHIYGENEAGGTAWLYLASVPFERLGFPAVGPDPPPRLTEAMQHGLFRGFIPPISLFTVLAAIMALSRDDGDGPPSAAEHER